MPSCRRRSFSLSSPPRMLLLLAVVLGVVLHGEGAMAVRPLRGIAEPPTPGTATGPAAQPGGGGRHDRSEAGAEVILAGFAAAVMVVIFCYIRVTRKGNGSVGPDSKQERLGGF